MILETKTAFTPGEWKVGVEDECPEGVPIIEIVCGESGNGQRAIAFVQPSFVNNYDFEIRDVDRANARLIAAAPALYAALSDLVGLVGNIFVGPWSIELDKARAALSITGGDLG